MSRRVAPKFTPTAQHWLSVGSRLHLGQLHKSLFYQHKPFINKYLQTRTADFESEGRTFESYLRHDASRFLLVGAGANGRSIYLPMQRSGFCPPAEQKFDKSLLSKANPDLEGKLAGQDYNYTTTKRCNICDSYDIYQLLSIETIYICEKARI